MIDRLEPDRLLVPASVAVSIGLAAVAAGHVYTGSVILIAARPLLAIVGPILAARRSSHDRIAAIAAYSTWSDTGLALGPLVGVAAVPWLGVSTMYALLALAILAALLPWRRFRGGW